jgi:hypothetical protein
MAQYHTSSLQVFDEAFDAKIKALMQEWSVPGLSLVLNLPNGETIIKSFGEREAGVAVTDAVGPVLKPGWTSLTIPDRIPRRLALKDHRRIRRGDRSRASRACLGI